jgi:uncharacterized protein
MPHFLYRIQPTRATMLAEGPTPQEAAIVKEHFDYLQGLVAEGRVFMAGRTLNTDERCFGIVVLAAASEVEAAALMRDDPAVRHGVMNAELFPYRIAVWSALAPSAVLGSG